MFRVIGGDGKEYGPAGEEEVRLWIAQGRVNGDSKIQVEGTEEWKTVRELPQFGAALAPPALPPTNAPVTSGMAIASLVVGVLGIVTAGLAGIAGAILGIWALIKINNSQGRLRGSGLAIAGICVSGFSLMLLPIMASLMLPALAKAKVRAQSIQCMNNVKQLNLALIMYADDHNDVLPPAERWCDLIKPYTGGSEVMFHCPAQPQGRCSYAFNAELSNRSIKDITSPARTILIFGSDEGWNQSGGVNSMRPHSHPKTFTTVGCADGHAEIQAPGRLASFEWEPRGPAK